jgi:hypothetical protein
MIGQPSLPRSSDRWIPWYFVAFFVALAAAMAVMAWLAIHSHTGE